MLEAHRHITENEPKNTWRSLEAGVYWHLFVVQGRYKRTKLS